MKRALMGLAAAAALALPAIGQVPQARADWVGTFDGCNIGEVYVTGTARGHHYNYVVLCGPDFGMWGSFRVQGGFDVDTGKAQERLTSIGGPQWDVKTTWNCGTDPWSREGSSINANICSNGAAAMNGATGSVPENLPRYWTSGIPYGARITNPYAHHVLNAQLQNAVKQSSSSTNTGPATHLPVTEPVGRALERGTSVVVASLPDLVAKGVEGNPQPLAGINGVYNVVVRNDGGPVTGRAELTISASGPLKLDAVVSAGGGFSCTPSGALIQCTGGTLDRGAQATVQVRVYAAAAGTGTVSASLNNSRALTESDYSNNVASLTLNVK